jgi:SAM-dependent methyltransferase
MNESADARGDRWVRVRNGRTLYRDTDAHVALILRTLGIDEAAWTATLDRYADTAGATGSVDDRLRALALAFHPASPHALPVPAAAAAPCPACALPAMRPIVARRCGDDRPPLVYGECPRCGHGYLLAGAAPTTAYEGDAYFRQRGDDGVGYNDYGGDREYRQAKGARLLEWIEQGASICAKAPAVLEVGSGFGFTLGAAMARGWRTAGVDINPAAARGARALYGIETVTATLGEALEAGVIARGAWDVVLYQFVLEHLAEPEVELRHAAKVIAPGGHLAVVVPNMSTFELDVFGASYRSLRADHRHLFSLASLRSYLASQGFVDVAHRTTCSLHLVRGFLDARELDDLYANDRGPDLFLLARRNV